MVKDVKVVENVFEENIAVASPVNEDKGKSIEDFVVNRPKRNVKVVKIVHEIFVNDFKVFNTETNYRRKKEEKTLKTDSN